MAQKSQGSQGQGVPKKNIPVKQEMILEIQKKPVDRKINGFLVSIDVSCYFKETNSPIKNERVELREKGVCLSYSTTQGSGYAFLEYTFGLDRANSLTTLDVLVDGYPQRQSVEISFPGVFQAPQPRPIDPEYLTIKPGYSRSLQKYYIIARLLQDRGVAMKQDLVIVIDGIPKTAETDENGYLQYIVPDNLAPQKPGDEVKVVVTANGIKEPTYGFLTWDASKRYFPIRKIIQRMIIAMPILWTMALIFGFSNSLSRMFFAAVMIYSTAIVPAFYFLFLSTYTGELAQLLRGIGRKIEEKFSTVAGDSTIEKIESFMSDAKSAHKTDASNIFSGTAGSSGKGFKGWLSGAFREVRSFIIDAAMFGGLSHLVKKIFR